MPALGDPETEGQAKNGSGDPSSTPRFKYTLILSACQDRYEINYIQYERELPCPISHAFVDVLANVVYN